MSIVSPLLKHAVYPSLSACGFLRHAAGAGVAVVTYHGVLPAGYRIIDAQLDGNLVSAEALRRQLRLLKARYHIIRPEEFLLWSERRLDLPPHSVLLTCDDCLHNTLTEMLPILQELHLSCLFFATGASLAEQPEMLWCDRLHLMFLAAPENFSLELPEAGMPRQIVGRQQRHEVWWKLVRELSAFDVETRATMVDQVRDQLGLEAGWDARFISEPEQRSRFLPLNASELRNLIQAGMCIGAHTLSHPVLAVQPADLAWIEISESRSRLEKALGTKIWALAYPFGGPDCVTSRELEMAARAGFQCAFLNVGGGFGSESPRFALPRVHVSGEMGLGEFEAHLSGFYRAMRRFLGSPEITNWAPAGKSGQEARIL